MCKNANKKNLVSKAFSFIYAGIRQITSLMVLFLFSIVLYNDSKSHLDNLWIHLYQNSLLAHTMVSYFQFVELSVSYESNGVCDYDVYVIYVFVFMISRTGSIANEIKAFNVVLRVLNPSADRVCTRLTLPIVTLRRIKTCFVKVIIDLLFCFKRVETEKKISTSRNYSLVSGYYLSGQGSSVIAST